MSNSTISLLAHFFKFIMVIPAVILLWNGIIIGFCLLSCLVWLLNEAGNRLDEN